MGPIELEFDISADAALIEVPVLFANGERDASLCHSFASTRAMFRNRMHAWSRSLGL